MSAEDHLSPVQFYHGTRAQLSVGEHISSGFPGNHDAGYTRNDGSYVYATNDVSMAAQHAIEHARGDAPPRVYQVSPTGHHEPDPEAPEDSIRSRSPLRITGEVPHPEHYY